MQFLGSGTARAAAAAAAPKAAAAAPAAAGSGHGTQVRPPAASAAAAPAAPAALVLGTSAPAVTKQSPMADGLDTGRFFSRHKEALRLMLEIMACSAPITTGGTGGGPIPMRRVRIETSTIEHIIEFWPLGTPVDLTHRVVALAAHFWAGRPGNQLKEVHVNGWYTTAPSPGGERKLLSTTLQRSELVFDIDLNDSADVRGELCDCGNTKRICHICMWLVHCGTRILVDALRRHYQYRHFMCCFSGRRGAHIHVHDAHACGLTNEERRSVAMGLTCPSRSGVMTTNAGAQAASADAKDTKPQTSAFFCPLPLKTQDINDAALCLPFFLRTYVRHKGIADTEAALLRFLSHTNAPNASKRKRGVGLGLSDDDAIKAIRDFCDTSRIHEQPGLAQWMTKSPADAPLPFAFGTFNSGAKPKTPSAAAATAAAAAVEDGRSVGERVWVAFYTHATMCEYGLLRPQRDARSRLLWTSLLQRFHVWLLTRFRPRLDLNVTPHVDHDVRMPWSVHPGTGRPVLPFDPDVPVDALVDFSDASQASLNTATVNALRLTRALHTELVLRPRRARPTLDF